MMLPDMEEADANLLVATPLYAPDHSLGRLRGLYYPT